MASPYCYYYYYTFLPRGKVRPADKLQLKAAIILPLVGLTIWQVKIYIVGGRRPPKPPQGRLRRHSHKVFNYYKPLARHVCAENENMSGSKTGNHEHPSKTAGIPQCTHLAPSKNVVLA